MLITECTLCVFARDADVCRYTGYMCFTNVAYACTFSALLFLLEAVTVSLITVEHLRLRLQICLNLTPISICLNFGLIVYFIESQVQLPKIIVICF